MPVEMVVRSRIIFLVVWVKVMLILIMRVLMSVCKCLVDMGMFVPLPVKAHDSSEHQRSGEPEKCWRLLAKQNQ